MPVSIVTHVRASRSGRVPQSGVPHGIRVRLLSKLAALRVMQPRHQPRL